MYIIILGFIFLIIGVLQILYPEQTYMFGRRWMYKEGFGLSEAAKLLIRVAGLVLIGISMYTFYLVIIDIY